MSHRAFFAGKAYVNKYWLRVFRSTVFGWRGAALAGGLLLYSSVVWADEISWIRGFGSTSWSDSTNWNPARLPTSTDDVLIHDSSGLLQGWPIFNIPSATVKSIQVGAPGEMGSLSFGATATALTVLGETLISGRDSSESSIYINQSGVTWQSRGDITVGNNGVNDASSIILQVQNGSTMNVVNNAIIKIGTVENSHGNFNVIGPTTTASVQDIMVGLLGGGAVTLSSGGTLNSAKTLIATGSALSTGQVKVVGNSVWNASNDIVIGAKGHGTVTVASQGKLNLAAGKKITIGQDAQSKGELVIGAEISSTPAQAGAVSGEIAFGSGSGSIIFNHTDESYQFSSKISGAGIVSNYSGNTFLSGNNSYSGPTTIFGGGLYINGNQSAASGPVQVYADGTLGGSGTIGGDVNVSSGGILRSYMENNSGHALTINGKLTATHAVLQYDFADASASPSHEGVAINVGGDVDITGATIKVNSDSVLEAGVYNLIVSPGTISTTQAQLDNDYNGKLTLKYNPGNGPGDRNTFEVISTAGLTLAWWNPEETNGDISGGDGTWTAGTSTSWSDSDGTSHGHFDDGSLPVFEGAAGTVTVDNAGGPITVSGMQFSVTGYHITGGEITLSSGENNFTVGGLPDSDSIATIDSVLAGNGSILKKSGLGTLILSNNNNSYDGGTIISGGTIIISEDGDLGAAQTNLTIGNGVLQFAEALQSDRPIILNSTGSTIDVQNKDIELSGSISEGGTLNKLGTGTLTLTGTNSYTGGTHIQSGVLSVSSGDNLGTGLTTIDDAKLLITATADISNAISLTSPSSLIDTEANDVTLSGAINGSGVLNKLGDGSLTLTGTNAQSGGVKIVAGTLLAGNDVNLGAQIGALTIGNATFKATNTFEASREVVLADTNSTIDTDTYDLTFSNTISGDGTLNKTGAGTLSLRGNNEFTGGVVVQQGTLNVDDDSNLGAGGGSLTLNGGNLSLGNDFSTSRHVILAASGGEINAEGHNGEFKGVISGAGNLDINTDSLGTIVFSAVNNYTGDTKVHQGELRIEGNQPNATGKTTVLNGASLSGNGTVGGDVSIEDGGQLRSFVDDQLVSHALTISGNLTANNAKLVYDYGVDALHNTIMVKVNGNINLTGSAIEINDTDTMAPGVYHLLQYSGNNVGTFPSLGNTPTGDFVLRTSQPNAIDLINKAGLEVRFWNPEGVDGQYVQGGSGTWEPGGSSNNWSDHDGIVKGSYTDGSFAVFEGTAGVVSVDNTNGPVTVSGIQFATSGYVVQNGAITLQSGVNDIRVGNGEDDREVQITATINSELIGAGRLQKNDAGILVLGGDNSYTGGTNIQAGTLRVSQDTNLGASDGDLSIGSGILQYADGFDTARTITVTSDLSRIDTQAFNASLTGTISGNGGLTKLGSGTLTLAGDDSFTGRTTIQEGTLALAGNATLAASDGVTVNGTLSIENIGTNATEIKDLDGNNAGKVLLGANTLKISSGLGGEFAGEISGTGSLHLAGGSLILTGDNTYQGGTVIDAAATLQLGSSGATGSITGPIELNGTLDFDRSDDVALDSVFTGSGTLNLRNGGTTTLTSSSPNFSGTTNLLQNQLVVNQVLGGQLTISEGATLSGSGMVGSTRSEGTIKPGSDTSMGVMTIAGNYEGDNAKLIIKTKLGDDNSETDRLHVTGDTSGNTNVEVRNQNGLGAVTKNGIRIIEVDGESDGVFRLDNGYPTDDGDQAVIVGAYAYTLKQGAKDGTDEDWYLRSETDSENNNGGGSDPEPTVRYNPATPLYSSYGQILSGLNQSLITSLRDRVGERLAAGGAGEQNPAISAETEPSESERLMWGRIDAAHNRLKPSGATTANRFDQDIWRASAGVDGQFLENQAGSLFGSLWLDYMRGIARVSSKHGNGKTITDGYGVGSALTWYGKAGLYVDAQAHLTRYDTDFELNETLTSPVTGQKDFGFGVGIEVGQDVRLNGNWSITPQMQLAYSAVDLSAFQDMYQTTINQDKQDSLSLRAGLSANYRTESKDSAGRNESLDVYGIVNVYRELLPQSHGVIISSVRFDAGEPDRTWIAVGGGGTYRWADSRFGLYGNISAATATDGAQDNYRVGGKLGMLANW